MSRDKYNRGVFAPVYYKNFKCIAERCRHSCCIDWEICIDKDTLEKYRAHKNIMETVTECDGEACFELCKGGRCPHLNASGLCNIIIEHGEDLLSEICRNHPRFFNDAGGRVEAGLGIVCEEACRLILENGKPFELTKIEGCDSEETFECDFDALTYRDEIISIIEKADSSFDGKLAVLQDKYELGELYAIEELFDILLSLEILDKDWEDYLVSSKGKCRESNTAYDKYYERLLTYFVYRHVSVAESEENLRARLAFAMLSAKTIRYLFETENEKSLEKLIDISRRYSAEIEYSEENTDGLIFDLECRI